MLRFVLAWLSPVFQGMGFGVLAMVLHEGGHLAVALLLGLRVYKFGVNWKGMYVLREAGPLASNLLVSIGPLNRQQIHKSKAKVGQAERGLVIPGE